MKYKNRRPPLQKKSPPKIFGSNLTLKSREARGVAQTMDFAVRSPSKNSSTDFVSTVVLGAGVEPACLAARNFKSLVYTNSTTRATKAWAGIGRNSRRLPPPWSRPRLAARLHHVLVAHRSGFQFPTKYARAYFSHEAWAGIEPAHRGFAVLCLTTWLPGRYAKL